MFISVDCSQYEYAVQCRQTDCHKAIVAPSGTFHYYKLMVYVSSHWITETVSIGVICASATPPSCPPPPAIHAAQWGLEMRFVTSGRYPSTLWAFAVASVAGRPAVSAASCKPAGQGYGSDGQRLLSNGFQTLNTY